MDNLKTYEFGADAETLLGAHESGLLPEHWEGAFRAMVADIVSMVDERPRSIYLCSADEDADARNYLGFILAGLVRERVPGVIVVDCDFLSVGLSGLVPHRDALGFLDLLLYGTSLGVIGQEAARGTKVVAAGSFSVTKKSPFATDAFATARRYLVNQAKCVIFVGPVGDDEENVHPIARNVDVVALVRVSDRFDTRFLDPLEQRIASIEGVEARSIRVNTRSTAPLTASRRRAGEGEPAGAAGTERPVGRPAAFEPAGPPERPPAASSPPPGAAGDVAEAVRRPTDETLRAGAGRKTRGSRAVRVIASLAALSAVVFIVWWLYLTRSVREEPRGAVETAGPPPAESVATPPADSSSAGARAGERGGAEPRVSRVDDSVRVATVRRDQPAAPRPEAEAAEKRTVPETSGDLLFVDTLDRFADQYVIHVSSFRGTEKANEEASNLIGWGYPVFIYHVDTGSKGMWYRVYVGPYTSRDEAVQNKIKLDESPRIRSTRVSKVPG